jgi:hypothetical protein
MTSKDAAIHIHELNLRRLIGGNIRHLYQVGFYAGQIQRLIKADATALFEEMKAAFMRSIELGNSDAEPSDPDRLPLYLEDITAGLANGACYPVTEVPPSSTRESLNPLRVYGHKLPKWLVMKLKVRYRGMAQNMAFQCAVESIPGVENFFQSGFDHWGKDQTGELLVTEPYDWSPHKEGVMRHFSQNMGARYRICKHPFHHQKTTRIEIGQFRAV